MGNEPPKPKPWMKWAVIFICWTGFALFFTSQSYIIQARSGRTIEWKRTLGLWLLGSYSWCLLTPFILQLSDRLPLRRGKLLRFIGIHSVAAVFFFTANEVIFIFARRLIPGPLSDTRPFVELFRSLAITEFLPG